MLYWPMCMQYDYHSLHQDTTITNVQYLRMSIPNNFSLLSVPLTLCFRDFSSSFNSSALLMCFSACSTEKAVGTICVWDYYVCYVHYMYTVPTVHTAIHTIHTYNTHPVYTRFRYVNIPVCIHRVSTVRMG